MTINRSARAEVIDLDTVRRKRLAQKVRFATDADDSKSLAKHMGFTRELADSITLQDALAIAQGIVDKFSAPGALFNAFVERRKREALREHQEFHQVLTSQRKYVAEYSPDCFKALMVLYKRNPSEYYETYVVPAAEEFLSRFRQDAEEA